MQYRKGWMAALVLSGLPLSACSKGNAGGPEGHVAPAKVEHIDGSEVSKVTLSARAAERLGIKTDSVRESRVTRSGLGQQVRYDQPGQTRKVVPYAAVLYDAQGETWVYTSPSSLAFVRQHIRIDYIEGDLAVLLEGPPVGTLVVTVGGAELFGAEFEIGH